MSALVIDDPGLLASVQDLGRAGFASMGVARSGAADALALRCANRLLGNVDGAAAIEWTLTGGAISALGTFRIVLAGASCEARLHTDAGARPIPMLTPITLRAGERIRIDAPTQGARTYLAVHGGIGTPRVLRSRSTHTTSGFGAPERRSLRAGDRLPILKSSAVIEQTPPTPARTALLDLARGSVRSTLRCVCTAAHAPVPTDALVGAAWTVARQSDRVGVRLEGGPIPEPACSCLPEAMHHGAIQRTRDGALVLLGPDSAPTGGYPVVGAVIACDLPALGQLVPGSSVRLQTVELEHARELWHIRERTLDSVLPARQGGLL